MRGIDLTGQRFGQLVAVRPTPERREGCVMWEVRCDCGVATSARATKLRVGEVRSCGCLRGRNQTHGLSRSHEYKIWDGMIQRCHNERGSGYERYGGRGIGVCQRWRDSFENFLADMGHRPSAEHSIERGNNDGNYEPGNCAWVTAEVQQNNTTANVRVTAFGETLTVAQWSRKTGVSQGAIYQRIYKKWPPERAVSEPSRRAAS